MVMGRSHVVEEEPTKNYIINLVLAPQIGEAIMLNTFRESHGL